MLAKGCDERLKDNPYLENSFDNVDVSDYNKGKVDGIKELIKELKQNSCFYDLIDYISFEAIDTDVIDEIAESTIKKIQGKTND